MQVMVTQVQVVEFKLSDGVTLSKILEVADKGVADKIEGINNFFG